MGKAEKKKKNNIEGVSIKVYLCSNQEKLVLSSKACHRLTGYSVQGKTPVLEPQLCDSKQIYKNCSMQQKGVSHPSQWNLR